MADQFDTWIDATQSQLARVQEALEDISGQLAQSHREYLNCRDGAVAVSSQATSLGGVRGRLLDSHNDLRTSSRHVALLSHSVEMAFSIPYLFRRMGVNLTDLVPPQVIEYNIPENRLVIEQAGPARLVLSNQNECHTLGLDQLGVDVPMRFELLGNQKRFELNIVIQGFLSVAQQTVSLQQAQLPQLCPPQAVTTQLRVTLLSRAFAEISRQMTASFFPPASFDMGLEKPVYTSAGILDSFRLFGVINRRPRAILPALERLPAWADAALKLASSELVAKVRDMMQQHGASLVDGPRFKAGNRFEVVGQKEVHEGIRIGCVEFSVTVRVRVTLDCHLSVPSSNEISFRASQVGSPDVDFESRPRLVPGVQRLIDRIVAELIDDYIPNIQLNETFRLSMAERLEIDLNATRLAAYMTLRV